MEEKNNIKTNKLRLDILKNLTWLNAILKGDEKEVLFYIKNATKCNIKIGIQCILNAILNKTILGEDNVNSIRMKFNKNLKDLNSILNSNSEDRRKNILMKNYLLLKFSIKILLPFIIYLLKLNDE